MFLLTSFLNSERRNKWVIYHYTDNKKCAQDIGSKIYGESDHLENCDDDNDDDDRYMIT